METKFYVQMLRKGWWIILLTVLVAVNATLIYSFLVTPRYQATTKLLVSPGAPMMVDGEQTINSLDTLDKRSVVATYNEFMNSEKVYLEALESVGLDKTTAVNYSRTAIILPDANVLEVTVEGTDPKIVAALSNAISEKGVNYIRKFYKVYDINPIDLAAVPTVPISPNPVRDSLLAFVFGLILGCALAILSEQIRIPFESLRQTRFLDNDSLAYTRRHFNRLLELEMMRCRTKGDVFSLGLIRLDGLADFIENIPQVLLQKILQNLTKSLKNDLKGTDVIGRWNDTTFAIILPSTPFIPANKLLGKIRQKLSEPVNFGDGGEMIRLEPYVGVARSKDDEVMEDFIIRVQKDLDENMFNVPTPPPPAEKPSTVGEKTTFQPETASVPPAQAPKPAATRLSALFAAAPPQQSNPVFPPPPQVRQADPFPPAPSTPVAPFITQSNPQIPPTYSEPVQPLPPMKPQIQPDEPKVRQSLYKGDILDYESPASELSQAIDEDLYNMRKNWKAN